MCIRDRTCRNANRGLLSHQSQCRHPMSKMSSELMFWYCVFYILVSMIHGSTITIYLNGSKPQFNASASGIKVHNTHNKIINKI